MSIEAVIARIQQIETAFAPPPAPQQQQQPATANSFSSMLQQASASGGIGATPSVSPLGGSAGQRMVQIAKGEVGQAEQPPGSNDSPRIAQYRSATAGAGGPAPWCAYFVSWVARQAGAPLGDQGQGFGAVDDLWGWAQRTGRAIPAGQRPQPGDLAVFNEHVGVVESVLPDGRIQTIEGNFSDRVARNVRPASDPIGYVRVG
jgi:hypothetical protein